MRNAPTLDLLSVTQAAEELCVSPRTVQHWIAGNKIAATKIGTGRTSAYVITRAEVERIRSTGRATSRIEYTP